MADNSQRAKTKLNESYNNRKIQRIWNIGLIQAKIDSHLPRLVQFQFANHIKNKIIESQDLVGKDIAYLKRIPGNYLKTSNQSLEMCHHLTTFIDNFRKLLLARYSEVVSI